MFGAIASWLLAGLPTAPAIAASPAAIQPLQPVAAWVVSGEAGECSAQRGYGPRTAPITLVLRADPFDGTATVLLVAKQGLALGMGKGRIVLAPGQQSIAGAYLGDRLADGREMVKITPRDEAALRLTALDAATSLTMIAGSMNLSFDTSHMRPAIAALKHCNELLVASWGVDPTEQAKIRTPAKPASPGNWVTPGDYPSDALTTGAQGDTRVLLTIDRSGAVTDCRVVVSSGVKALDNVGCRAMTSRGRFAPALDGEGQPVPSHAVERISWRVG